MPMYCWRGPANTGTSVNHVPFGNVDGCNAAQVVGWVGDEDQSAVTVRVYIDGVLKDVVSTTIARPDVRAALPQYVLNTGWQSFAPAAYQDGLNHTVRVFGIDDLGSTETELLGSPATFRAASSQQNHVPFGNLETVSPALAIGWAGDEDQNGAAIPAGTVAVKIYIDGALVDTVHTGLARLDVSAALPQYNGITGWQSSAPAAYSDGQVHTLRAKAVDDDSSEHELPNSPQTFVANGAISVSRITQMWDGLSGMARDWWNYAANVPWQNSGGDFAGLNGVAQDTNSPYGILDSGTGQGDVTQLVKDWIQLGNTGAIVRPASDAWFAGKNSSAPPSLVVRSIVNSVLTTFNCACTAVNVLPLSSDSPAYSDGFSIGAGGSPMGLQFNLSAISGSIQSATMGFTRIAFTAGSLYVYRCTPQIVPTQWARVPGGLSANVSTLAALNSAPGVLYARDWPGINSTFTHGTGIGGNPAPAYSTDSTIAVGTAQFSFTADPNSQYEPIGEEIRRSDLGQSPLTEAYLGFWIRFDDAGVGIVDGCKIGPGISGQYGAGGSLGVGPYVNGPNGPTGNGGRASSGLYYAAGTGGNSSDFGGAAYYSGVSARTWVQQPVWEAGNPLAAFRSMQDYVYWAGMPGDNGLAGAGGSGFGQNFIWGGVQFLPNTWYWVEKYLRMNTVSAPYDGFGNGTAVADGDLKVWVNGNPVQIMDYQLPRRPVSGTWIWRRNKNFGIDQIPWIDMYHGGTAHPTATSRVSLGAICAATSYIGPPSFSPTPAWLAGKALNTWINIPGTTMDSFPTAGLNARGYLTGGDDGNIGSIFNYSGADIDRSTSTMFFYGGGGAGAWRGNEVRSINLEADSPLWTLFANPSFESNTWARNATGSPHLLNMDGQPQAMHSYYAPFWSSISQKFYIIGEQNWWDIDGGHANKIFRLDDRVTPQWIQTNFGIDYPTPGATVGGRWDSSWHCSDPATGKLYISGPQSVCVFTPTTTTSNDERADFFISTSEQHLDLGAGAIGNGKLLIACNGQTQTNWYCVDIATGFDTAVTMGGSGASGVSGDPGGWQFGASLEYDDGLAAWLAYTDNDSTVYKIVRNSDASFTATALVISTGDGAPTAGGSGTRHGDRPKGRFRYVPRLKGFVLFQRSDGPAKFVRTA